MLLLLFFDRGAFAGGKGSLVDGKHSGGHEGVFFFFLIVRGAEEHGMERFVVFFSFFLLVGVFSLVWYSVR